MQLFAPYSALAYQHFPSLDPPWPLSMAPRRPPELVVDFTPHIWPWIVVLTLSLFALAFGLLIVLAVRPRDFWGDISAGVIAALAAALTSFFVVSGPTSTWSYEEAAIERDVGLLANSSAMRENSQQDLLKKYPDLGALPEEQRSQALAQKIHLDLLAGSFQGIWQGLLEALVFLPAAVCQAAVAGHLLRRGGKGCHVVVPYLELALLVFFWSVWLGMFPGNPRLLPPWRWRASFLLLLSTAWLALALLSVFRGWGWWWRWLLHVSFATAAIEIWAAINNMTFSMDVNEL